MEIGFVCITCKRAIGFTGQAAAYCYYGIALCPTHMDNLDHDFRLLIDRAIGSTSQFRRSEQLSQQRRREL